jgi:hypothetical protein
VIAALSFGTAPLSTAPAAGCLAPFPPLGAPQVSPLSNVDTLLGMATSLWPILHRLSNLLSLKQELETAVSNGQHSKVVVLRTEFETTSGAIENALNQWKPHLPTESRIVEDEEMDTDENAPNDRGRFQSILNNALAYKHSAFVYLYRTIYCYPQRHHLVQRHTHLSLTHCVATVANAGPMGALLWPLFVAACEALTPADRDLARVAFVAVDKRQGMKNIDRAWQIVQEVWRRADQMGATPEPMSPGGPAAKTRRGVDLWRRVSQDMGVTIIFG